MVAPTFSSLPQPIRQAKAQVINRARTDRDGIFWSLPPTYRSQAEPLECSLGFGSAGVLLALLEIHQFEPTDETEQLLLKGADWLIAQLQKRGFHHGFYAGSAGVWYALNKLEHTLPGIPTEWRSVMRDQASSVSFTDTPAGLVGGAAGSLLGALLISSNEDLSHLESILTQCLLASTKLAPEGVFWDFNPTSLRAPAGFAYGNAGVDYALTAFRQFRGWESTSLLAGSIHYTDSLFDRSQSNWLDYDSSVAMRQLDQEGLAQRIQKGAFAHDKVCSPAEDSIAWGGGTCGMLLSRSYVRKAFAGDPIGEQAERDCVRAFDRFARVSDEELSRLDSSILHGLPGVILSLQECLPYLIESESAVTLDLIHRGRSILESRSFEVEGEDLSLLSGISGLMHAALPQHGDRPLFNLTHPVTRSGDPPVAHEGNTKNLDLTPLLDRRLPLTKAAAGLAPEDIGPIVTLKAIRELADTRVSTLNEPQKRAVEYEFSLHETLSQAGFQELFWRELECQMRFSRFYDEGMDDLLLTERFKLSSAVKILQLDFDPHSGSIRASESPHLILRHRTSRGVLEVKISELQFALLREFESEAWTMQAIADVIRRVDSAQVTQRQLADLAKQNIRAFVREGYLESVRVPRARKWWCNHAFRQTRRHLFPQSSA